MTFDHYGHLFPRSDSTDALAAADAAFFNIPLPPAPTPATVHMLRPSAQEAPVNDPPMPVPISAIVEAPQPQVKPSPIVAVEPEPRPSNIARAADARTALGQFAPGPRPQPLMDKARAALAAHPEMSVGAISRMVGCSKKTVLNAKNGLPVRRPRRAV
jgi:hypothetical protein